METMLNKPQINENHLQQAKIYRLVKWLESKYPRKRIFARNCLISIGKPAIAALSGVLADPNQQLRWEAARVLSAIHDPMAAPGLVRALGDGSFDVRWSAAEGLIALGNDAVKPLLLGLLDHDNLPCLTEGAHHVLHQLAKEKSCGFVKPVLDALDDELPGISVPMAVNGVLRMLPAKS